MEQAMNLKSKTALAALSLIASSAAFAQAKAPEPDYTLAYNVGAVSDYRVRAITQTANQASLQGGVDFAHKSGIYLGVWGASNLKWIKEFNGASKGDYEVDLYGGYKAEFMPGLSYDVGVITYQYPGNDSGAAGTAGAGGFSNASTTEFYGAITYSVATLKYNQSMGDFLGNLNSNGSRYWDLSANFDLGNGMTLTPHVGRQTIPNQNFAAANGVAAVNDGTAANYTDYALTFAKDFGNGLAVTAAVVGTDAKEGGFYTQTDGRFLAKSGFIAGVKYTF
jgi:uncharacterized protein (TIGR02001 family)